MESYLICLIAYFCLNVKADESHYKITLILGFFITIRWLLPTYGTEDTILFLTILDSITVLLLLIVSKDKVTSTLIGVSVIPKVIDILLCNFSDGNVPLGLLLMTLNADEYLILGVVITLLVKENVQLITKLHIDPRVVGYRLWILDGIFGMVLLSNLFY